MSTMSDFVNSGASNQAQVDAIAKVLSYMPNRNRIINGKMEIAQRGTNFPALAHASYSIDRFIWLLNGATGVCDISQQADAPTEFIYSYRATVKTADTTIVSADHCLIRQTIEGFNISDLIGRTFTVSYWIKSSKTGVHCVALRNGDNTHSYVAEVVVNAANTWEYKTFVVQDGLPSSITWDKSNGLGLVISFVFAAGPSFQTTPNMWTSGTMLSTVNQVNCLDTVGNIFAITGVQLEAGEVATPFEHRSYGQELALCKRYYYQINDTLYGSLNPSNLQGVSFPVQHPVDMRNTPNVVFGSALVDANFVSGSPGVPGKWTAIHSGVTSSVVKTGTASFSSVVSSRAAQVLIVGASFSVPVSRLIVSAGEIIASFSAEL